MGVTARPVEISIDHSELAQQGGPVLIGTMDITECHDPARRVDIVATGGKRQVGEEQKTQHKGHSVKTGHGLLPFFQAEW